MLVCACALAVTDWQLGERRGAAFRDVVAMPGPAARVPAPAVDSLSYLRTPPSPADASPPAADDPRTRPLSSAEPPDLQALSAVLGVPVAGVLRSQLRDSYTERRGDRVHEAMDILVARGTPVVSAADGRVLKLFDSKPGGLMVYATDPSGRFILLYGHLDGYAAGLRDGMPLTRGQVIGYVGTTGNAAPGTPHLHFAILRADPDVSWWKGEPVNPYLLLAP